MVFVKTLFETLTQTGGAKQVANNSASVYIYLFVLAIISLLIKSYLVELSYNSVMQN